MKLGVWNDGRRIATISETRNRMSLAYEPRAGRLGTPLVMQTLDLGVPDAIVRRVADRTLSFL